MGLMVIGAGLGRTGTTSVKAALEILLDRPCYHMATLHQKVEDIPVWYQAGQGVFPDWNRLFAGFGAMADWPGSAFYQALMGVYPEAKVLLTYREPEAWLQSCKATIFPNILNAEGQWGDMVRSVIFNTFTRHLDDDDRCIEAYRNHLGDVREFVPSDRLIEWQPGDGWEPLCSGLQLPIPDQPYPRVNTTEDFRKRMGQG